MTTLTHEPATDAQIKQLARVAADAADKAVREFTGLTKEGAQRVHGSAEFAACIRNATVAALTDLSATDQFADEEVRSRYGYRSGYNRPKHLAKQIEILRGLFPNLNQLDDFSFGEKELPKGAEGFFAIPRWQALAPTYGEAVQKVLDALAQVYGGKFYNYRQNQLGPDQFRQSEKSLAAWEQLAGEQQDHDILVVPAQFGIRHRGRSVRRARVVMTNGEFGLGEFAVGIMLLTHPERLQHYDDLWIDCAGDEYHDPQGSGAPFDLAPCFRFIAGRLGFDAGWCGSAHAVCGSASGWSVPQ